MSNYLPPVDEMIKTLAMSAGFENISKLPGYEDMDLETAEAILHEAARLAADVWAPLNKTGDVEGAKLDDNTVTPANGFKEAYQAYVKGGWNGLTHTPDYGGQGLPWVLGMAVNEMWQAANMSLALNPMLTHAAIEALTEHGTDAQKNKYLEKLITGEWTGTMNLTEPQAGTDLSAIRTLAVKDGDHYRLRGQKIYITWGDHDFTDNIIHMVLARMEGLPEGNKGLGLFLVPKYLVADNGSLGARNDVYSVALEHKLGIHGSPTCVMQYGETDGAVGYLIGEAGAGLKNMFTMMNNARIAVGLQGVAIADRACQAAHAYAQERVQSARLGSSDKTSVPIIEHGDVQRMIYDMQGKIMAGRALAYYAGSCIDQSRAGITEQDRAAAARRADFLTPLVKAWCTDMAVDVTSTAIQVHGGMGFIEETGVAQYYRDARILPIYEGTNGIQAMDFTFRKVIRDQGGEAMRYLAEMRADLQAMSETAGYPVRGLGVAIETVEDTTRWILNVENPDLAATGAVKYTRQFALMAAAMLALRQVGSDKNVMIQGFVVNAMAEIQSMAVQVKAADRW